MKLLDHIGLGRKHRPGDLPAGPDGTRSGSMGRWLLLIGFFGLLMAAFPGSYRPEFRVEIGDVWRSDDLIAPFTFSLLKPADELAREIADIRANTPSIFKQQAGTATRIQAKLDSFYVWLEPALEAHMLGDSTAFKASREQAGLNLDDRTWAILADDYKTVRLASMRSDGPPARFIGTDIRLRIEFLVDELLSEGVIDIAKSGIEVPAIVVRNERDRTQRTVALALVRDLSEAREYAGFRFGRTFGEEGGHAAQQLFDAVMEPDLVFDAAETKARVDEAVESVSPTRGAVPVGELIIRQGETVNADSHLKLRSLAAARQESADPTAAWIERTGQLLVLMGLFLPFLLYLYLYRNPIFDRNHLLALVLLATGITCAIALVLVRYENVSLLLVPVAVAPIILTIIYDSRVGLLTTVTLGLFIAFLAGNQFEYAVAGILAGSLAVFSVRDVRNRSQFFLTTPALVFTGYAVVLGAFSLIEGGSWSAYGRNLGFVAGQTVLIWLTYPLILLFEKLFRVTTDVSLLELNDHNHPLIKLLMNRAPGTYQHSLQVANLAEAAAAAIGANSLLCRVGALYHDVGKTDRPEYFVENQQGLNEHDKLKPRMSVLVIKNHVTVGLKLAEEHNLPGVVSQFIATHHGDGIIRYFHDLARKQADNPDDVREEDFRYDGPLPSTKETGIVMLADGIEAAARAMRDPNYAKLENLVNRMVDERLVEGQLRDCPLTFQDLRIIKESFHSILVGVYHSRIAYPGQKE